MKGMQYSHKRMESVSVLFQAAFIEVVRTSCVFSQSSLAWHEIRPAWLIFFSFFQSVEEDAFRKGTSGPQGVPNRP